MKWRTFHNSNSNIELRTTDVFMRALINLKKRPNDFWSFEEYPVTIESTLLSNYWKEYDYMDLMRKLY